MSVSLNFFYQAAKNTRSIISAWVKHPEWPKLVLRTQRRDHLLWYEDCLKQAGRNKSHVTNIDFSEKRMTNEEFLELQNSIGIHLSHLKKKVYFGNYLVNLLTAIDVRIWSFLK